METAFLFGSGLVIGLVLGSFTTVLSHRIPRGLSIVSPPSHCPACKNRLGVIDLVPVFSWLWNKGRCRHCGTKISARYPLIELAVALPSALAFTVLGISVWLLPVLALLVGGVAWIGRQSA